MDGETNVSYNTFKSSPNLNQSKASDAKQTPKPKEELDWCGCCSCLIFLVIIPLFMIIVYALDSGTIDSPYSVTIHDDYQLPMMTKEYGIEFYVKNSHEFDQQYPVGTSARIDIENLIINEYFQLAWVYCYKEEDWHSKRRDFTTPICDKLRSLGIHESYPRRLLLPKLSK